MKGVKSDFSPHFETFCNAYSAIRIIPGTKKTPVDVFFFGFGGRGKLKQPSIYLFLLINNSSINLLGTPVGMLCDLASHGQYLLSSAPHEEFGIESIRKVVVNFQPWVVSGRG